MRFKTNKVHRLIFRDCKPYYACNRAVGKLSREQIMNKTNLIKRKITCENCRKYHKYKNKYRE